MEDSEPRRCSAPNCTSVAAINAHLCKACQTRRDRGLLPNYTANPPGRPKKLISDLCQNDNAMHSRKLRTKLNLYLMSHPWLPSNCLLCKTSLVMCAHSEYSAAAIVTEWQDDRKSQFGARNDGSESSEDTSPSDSFKWTLGDTDSLSATSCFQSYHWPSKAPAWL